MSQFIVFYKGNQYDVNAFLDSHPAGRDIILPFEGKDMTEDFEAVGHSKSAVRILNKYLIGSGTPVVTRREPEENENVVIKKLFTAEDQYQVHKLLGAFALFSFAYRYFYMLPLYGNLGFVGSTFDIVTLFAHFALSSSSLLFHVLDRRIVEHPLIIYEEYRLHAILFTSTAISVSLFGLYADQYIEQQYQKFALIGIIFALRGLVDFVTYVYGTKGVTAVRNNNDGEYKYVRLFYSFYQICALGSFITVNPNLNNLGFNTLIAIQSSTFLMTLKRKSLIRWKSHMFWYSFSLVLSYYVMYLSKEPTFFLQMLVVFFFRVKFNMNKYLLWSSYATVYYLAQNLYENDLKTSAFIM